MDRFTSRRLSLNHQPVAWPLLPSYTQKLVGDAHFQKRGRRGGRVGFQGCCCGLLRGNMFSSFSIYFSSKPKASTSHGSSMRFACMDVSTGQVFWNSFQLANSGLHTSKISTYPALKLIAQQFKFSCRCHSFQTDK